METFFVDLFGTNEKDSRSLIANMYVREWSDETKFDSIYFFLYLTVWDEIIGNFLFIWNIYSSQKRF